MYNTFGRVPVGPTINAGFWRRSAAYLIDALLLSALTWVAAVAIAFAFLVFGLRDGTTAAALTYVVMLVIEWLYFALQESSAAQASLGKRAFGIKIVDERGERITFGRATFRFFGKILSCVIAGIGLLMAGITARKQGLHDLLAGTFVVFHAANPGQPIPVVRPTMPWYGWLLNGALLSYPLILAAFALPAYANYMARAQAVEGFIASEALKTAVAEFYIEKSRCPLSAIEVQLGAEAATSSKYVDKVMVEPDCVIAVTFADSTSVSSSLRGQRIEVTGRPDANGVLDWTCSGTIAFDLLPVACRKQAER